MINKGPSIMVANNDNDAINIVNGLSGNNYTTIGEALGWVSIQSDVYVQNKTMENIVIDGLVLHLDASNVESYPKGGTTWYDMSGNSINGTMSNSTMGTIVPGEMILNNTTDDLSFGHRTEIEPDNLTISAWINLLDRSDRHILLTKWLGWSFEIHADGRPYFRLNGVSPGDLYSSESLVWGDWYYITGVFNNDTSWGDIYVNGVNRGGITRTGPISYNQGTFNIPYVNSPGYAYGKIAQVLIYNKALSSEEVLQNYNATKYKYSMVFGYDLGNIDSYIGEPTTNVLPNPQYNGRFTTSNAWGTYNTNQYNSNTYFSIGTIGDVTNNVVTLSSVVHAIRSFDVLRAQTTGGGVTAGTEYVIKKHSSTTFSLHAYNSSQNGSLGYTNPSTGFFKVHDAYANDIRISINSTSFPTMWWGAPHRPNSGLIKEIVTSGGYVPNTNCMRLHIYRGDSVVDGMAYGAYTPVTQGDIITVSYWIRSVNSNSYSKTLGYSTHFGGAAAGGGTSTLNSTGKWQKVSWTWTASVTYNFISYWWPQASTDIYAIDMADIQIEVNRGHATQYTSSSRSVTEGLLDLTGDNTIDLSNVGFDSTAHPTFNSTSNYMLLASNGLGMFDNQSYSIEVVFKPNQRVSDGVLFSYDYTDHSGILYAIQLRQTGTGFLFLSWNDGTNYKFIPYSGINCIPTTGVWYHVVASYTSGKQEMWVNNVLKQSSVRTDTITFYNQEVWVGKGNWGGYYDGDIDIVKVYNKVLSQEEISYNFEILKDRFNI